jgi:hypothetical protein
MAEGHTRELLRNESTEVENRHGHGFWRTVTRALNLVEPNSHPFTIISPSTTAFMENTRPGDGLTIEQLLDVLRERFESMWLVSLLALIACGY